MKLCYLLLSLFLVSTSSAEAISYDSSCKTIIANPGEEEDLDFSYIDGHTNNGGPKTLPILPEAHISGNSLYFRNGCTHAQLRILSSDGSTVVLNEIINDGDVVSIQDLPAGIYCVQIIRESYTFAAIINRH